MRGWTLRYDSFQPAHEGLREALCTLGNGYFATRGAAEHAEADEVHYPGTYIARGYNRLRTNIAGRMVENEDLVNFPNWTLLRFRPVGGQWFDLRQVEILSFRQELHLRAGVLERAVRAREDDGRITLINTRRIVHMESPHLAAIRCVIEPENWSGELEIISALDGRVRNAGVKRYRQLRNDHLEPIDAGEIADEGIWLRVRTSQSRLEVTEAARTRLYRHNEPLTPEWDVEREHGYIQQRCIVQAEANVAISVEKIVALYTSRDHAIAESSLDARQAVVQAPSFEQLLVRQNLAWRHLWQRCDLLFSEPTGEAELILRLHIFHLLQTASVHSIEQDFGVPARGLHGEAYRGHIFWDELFIFPFLNLRMPEVTRALLRYRSRRLPAARKLARDQGFAGALFPWQSGSNGREETQSLHLNPRSGRWLPDNTHLQRHVNAAIAFNIWQYVQTTDDREFLAFFGAEMFLEIARFWASAARFSEAHDRYEIRSVVGPDEYHDRYPDRAEPGLRNNAYTNVMASWVLSTAVHVLAMLEPARRSELIETLELRKDEPQQWDEISRRLFIPFHGDGIISQFEGYENLCELDWDGYEKTYGKLHRLDRILEAEGDDVNRYKVSKQADVLMLFYLFSPAQVNRHLRHMGYELDHDMVARNIEYYLHRTDHGSTLSRVVHSWVLARFDHAHAWSLFNEALRSDVSDIQGGTTSEGIHLGAMAGTVDLAQRCFTGFEIHDDVLWFDPALPDDLGDLRLCLRYRNQWLRIRLNHQELVLKVEQGTGGPIAIGFDGTVHHLLPGQCREFPLHEPAAPLTAGHPPG